MKVASSVCPPPPAFAPVSITLTLESADEVGAFYALFNFSSLCTILRHAGLDPAKVRGAIKAALDGEYPTHENDYFDMIYDLVNRRSS